MYELDSSILAVLTTKIDGNERSARLSKMNCNDWSWIWPNMGLGFSPISPSNEFIECGWKN